MAIDDANRRAQLTIEETLRSRNPSLDLSVEDDEPDSAKLTQIPSSVRKLTHVESLDLSNNNLATLPDWFGELTNITTLALGRNRLGTVPEALSGLTRLKNLDLYKTGLSYLPKWFERFQSLRELQLGSNYFPEVPTVIRQLDSLTSLKIYNCGLDQLPQWIGELKQLRVLEIDANNLTTIPTTLSQLSRLTYLEIGGHFDGENPGNPLKTLPEHIGQLRALHTLNVRDCQLTDLPTSLAELHRLTTLDLDDNPLNLELAAAYDEGLASVKRYLRAKAGAQVLLNEAKLILIGEGEVGKSCLLAALRGDEWVENRDTTHGIEIKSVELTDPITKKRITMNGWDFGGQRVYRPTHQLFFSSPAVYLVIWKPREGPQQGFVKEWITLIKHREPDAKILVVATHGGPGGRQPDIDRQEIWDVFGKHTVIDFFRVESKPPKFDKRTRKWTGTCKGIKELRDAIARVAASLPEVGRSVPKRWNDVRGALMETGQAFLPLENILVICADHKMAKDEASDFLRVSHRLGHLIHYEHDPILQNVVVLKPDWLATAISFVLDDEETRKNHGLVKSSRLGKLWTDKSREAEFRYPAAVHSMFVNLMQRFDLSYRVAGSPLGGQDDETSLIAQLVPDVRPQDEISREWPESPYGGYEQQLQICRIVDGKGQSATAEGLFYQLIVRLHKLSLGREDFNRSVHWQRGLIIDDDYNGRALLEYIGNDVHITVRAPYPANLLAVLTREVKWLVEDFWEGLRCEIVVPCIEPCGKNAPSTGVFEVQKLIAFKRQGMSMFPCTASGCDQLQDIRGLLQNAPIAQRPPIELLLTEGFADMRSRLDELRRQNSALDQNLRRIMSQVEDAFRGVMQTLTDEAKEAPRLFSLEPVGRSAFNPTGWTKKKFRVTLWCEHTRLPLPLINGNDDKGVYEFEVTREWFAKAAPFLKVLAGTLSLMLPVAASTTKLVLDEAVYKNLENQLDLGKHSAEAMLKVSEKTVDWLSEKEGIRSDVGVIHAEGGVLREFQTWLKKEDSSYGDLRRVLNKRQEFLWVHPDYEKEY
jgi:hypothetical protein